jgi:antitoxin YefM
MLIDMDDSERSTSRSDKVGRQAILDSVPDAGSWRETLYLLSSPANVEHLRRSIDEADTGKVSESELIDP